MCEGACVPINTLHSSMAHDARNDGFYFHFASKILEIIKKN